MAALVFCTVVLLVCGKLKAICKAAAIKQSAGKEDPDNKHFAMQAGVI